MDDDGRAQQLWAVAGCLFEVALPAAEGGRWRRVDGSDAVTLLAEDRRRGRHHFRFRAEAAGSHAGVVELRFRSEEEGAPECSVQVHVAPERLDGG